MLKGCTERNVRCQIENSQIIAEEIRESKVGPGRGGIQYRIPLSALDKRLQAKFKRRLTALKRQKSPLPSEQTGRLTIEGLSSDEISEVLFWKQLLKRWQDYRSECGLSAEDADVEFLKLIETERIYSTDARRREFKTPVRRTLYRKLKALREQGEAALADGRGKHGNHKTQLLPEVWDIFEHFYLDQNRRGITLCRSLTELALKEKGRNDLLPLPSESTFARAVKKIPVPYIKYFRDGMKTFIGECSPYIKRIYDDLESNDIWVADNHTFDIMARKNGSPVRVYFTAFMDVRSRKFTGWCLTDAPSSDATIYALKRGCEEYGAPKEIYTDNGREFLTHDLGGTGFRHRAGDTDYPSILKDLGIEFRAALPENARAKGIERAFNTVKEQFSKLFESYTGGTVLEKPDRLKTVVKNGRLPEISQLSDYINAYIRGWYNNQPHTGEGMNGRTPDEAFAAELIEKRVIPPEKLELMFMRYAKGKNGRMRVGKNGVTLSFYGRKLQYYTDDLWRLHFGKKVYVRYAPDDLSSVLIYDSEMRFICRAGLKTELGYKASKNEIRESMKLNRQAVKSVAMYKHSKNINEQDALKLMLNAAADRIEDGRDNVNPKVIRLLSGPETEANSEYGEYQQAAGGETVTIDWEKAVERLRLEKAKAEGELYGQ